MKLKKLAPKKNAAQAIVEFAIVLPLLLLLLYGLLEAGRLLFMYSSVVTASRQAARYGSASGWGGNWTGVGGPDNSGVPRYQDCYGIRQAAQKADFLNAFDDGDINIDFDDGATVNGNCNPDTGAYIPANDNTSRIVVTVSGTFHSIVPKIVPFITRTIEAESARTILVNITIPVAGGGGGGDKPDVTVTTSPYPSQVNEPVTVTATLSIPSATGEVTFKNHGGSTICTAAVVSGTASCAGVTFSAIGSYIIDATYTPDSADYVTNDGSGTHIVGPSTTITTITTDTPDPSLPGTSVTIYVTVGNQYGGDTPTGTVAISTVNGGCNITLSAGMGACSVTMNTVGNSTITANYTPTDATKHKPSSGTAPHTVSTSLPTDVPTAVPTAIPTAIPTTIPTAVPTPVLGCDSLRNSAGSIKFSGKTMTLSVPNANGYDVAIDHVFVAWNYSAGHSPGDPNLWLEKAELNSTVFWAETPISQPGATLLPSTPVSIPANKTAKFTFTFNQIYTGNTSGVEQVHVYLSTPGCEGYPVLVPSSSPTITPAPAASAKLQYRAADVTTDPWIKPYFNIVNTGSSALPLSGFKIRYWYTSDGATSQSFYCDYAAITGGCSNVTSTFVAVSPARTGADYYLEVGFTAAAGSIASGGQSGEIQARFNRNDWLNYTETGDYSYDSTKSLFADWTHVTLYYNGVLIWGTEP